VLSLPPIALYVHLPWCVRKCPYCDFNSHAAPSFVPAAAYVTALLEDLESEIPHLAERRLVSIFIGGGTPSLFAPAEIARLLGGVRSRMPCAPDVEITMEANPGAVERGSFAGYRDAGVTRVSLGAQSFDDRALAALGRVHSAHETDVAAIELQQAGIANFNLDLMFGLPQQTVAAALADVERALSLGPTHVSHYQLTLEPGTVFHRRPPPLPDQDDVWDMQVACEQRLAGAGFARYEVSAYAQPGRHALHNLNYWRYGDYIGIGAGAHGKWTAIECGRILRSVRIRQPREYLTASAADRVAAVSDVGPADRAFEFVLNALRLLDGFAESEFEARTGQPIESLADPMRRALQRGLLERADDGRWRPTDLGMRFLNDLQALFLP
jgi:putative oxygen-independent coproporphyrinogen III oxidase